ncbi:hypothetical protein V1511DRAFT_508122 [Dipodascopsis uninucleata]
MKGKYARFLYRCSLFFLVFFTTGFLIVTPADLISQALLNKQRYNIIIVAATYFGVGAAALVIYLNRLYEIRVTLADIPKRYVPGDHDVPKSCASVIASELIRCQMIQNELQPDSNVTHAGMPRPKHSEFDFPQVPYIVVLTECAKLLEQKIRILHSSFQRRPGMPFRDYMNLVEEQVVIDKESCQRFIDGYEYARFSGAAISEDQFRELIASFTLLIRNIDLPDDFSEGFLERIDSAATSTSARSWDEEH